MHTDDTTDHLPYMSERYRTDPEYRAKVDAGAAQIPPMTDEHARFLRNVIVRSRRERATREAKEI